MRIDDGSQVGGAQVDNIPVIERASLSTQAVIDEGDSLLIAGAWCATATCQEDYRVPLLGSVPVLGRLFRSTRDSVSRVERLFLITPARVERRGLRADRGRAAPGGPVAGRHRRRRPAARGRDLAALRRSARLEPLDAGPSGTLIRAEPIEPGTGGTPIRPRSSCRAPVGTPDPAIAPRTHAPPRAPTRSPARSRSRRPWPSSAPRTSAPTGSADSARSGPRASPVEPWPDASADSLQR